MSLRIGFINMPYQSGSDSGLTVVNAMDFKHRDSCLFIQQHACFAQTVVRDVEMLKCKNVYFYISIIDRVTRPP